MDRNYISSFFLGDILVVREDFVLIFLISALFSEMILFRNVERLFEALCGTICSELPQVRVSSVVCMTLDFVCWFLIIMTTVKAFCLMEYFPAFEKHIDARSDTSISTYLVFYRCNCVWHVL